MKVFEEKHETIIEFYFSPIANNPKSGDIIPHQKTVSRIYFYNRQFLDGQEVFVKIELTKEMILDLHNKICDIENQVVEMPFDSLLF